MTHLESKTTCPVSREIERGQKDSSESDHNYNSDLNEVIRQVKEEFKTFLAKRRELIIKLGEAFERTVSNSESICEEIKNTLAEEIAQSYLNSRYRKVLSG